MKTCTSGQNLRSGPGSLEGDVPIADLTEPQPRAGVLLSATRLDRDRLWAWHDRLGRRNRERGSQLAA